MGMSRRQFLGTSAAAVLVAGTMAKGKVFGANEKVRMAVIGFHGRGRDHIKGWSGRADSEVVALCDVDASVVSSALATFKDKGKTPKTYTDMRKLFEDKDVDAVSIATPNHWHSLAAIWAMQAGKDVYVEKPCSHNVWEGRQLVNAARKYNRVCQHGTQIRSASGIIEAMQKLRDGVIGEVYMARGLCYKTRDTIGHKEDCPVPEGVDHYGNFLAAVKARDPKKLNAEIEEGHLSSSLCHLGLIAAKLGRELTLDPKQEQVVGDEEANKLLKGPYDFRAPFTVPEIKV